MRTTSGRRRGLVILVVMVVVTLSALVGSSVLLMGEHAGASTTYDRRLAQSRLTAWSGVQAVMAELNDQREDLLQGGDAAPPASWSFPIERSDGPAFRLAAPRGGAGGEGVVSENAKLDVNLATPEMLAALPMIDESLARAIASARPFGSLAELALVEGVSAEMLYGSSPGPDGSVGELEGGLSLDASGEALTLVDALTVFSFDPNVQMGLGEDGESHAGKRRIDLGLGWSDALERGLRERWDESAAAMVRGLFEQGESIAKTSDVVALYRRFGVPASDWAEGLDALTTFDGEHVRGLVDINRAPAAVLAAIPGIDEASARAIVDARERLGLEQRRSIVWPVVEGVLSEEAFEEASDWLTTRSTQWRVWVEGGTLEAGGALAVEDGGEAPAMRDRVLLECVIDVSSRRPRVAYMRDVTGLGLALAMHGAGGAGDEGPGADGPLPDAFDDGLVEVPFLGETPVDGFGLPDSFDPVVTAPIGTSASEAPSEGGEAQTRPVGRIGRWTGGEGAP